MGGKFPSLGPSCQRLWLLRFEGAGPPASLLGHGSVQPVAHIQPRMVLNVAQHKVVNLRLLGGSVFFW